MSGLKKVKALAFIISCVMLLPLWPLTGCSFVPSKEDVKKKIAGVAEDGLNNVIEKIDKAIEDDNDNYYSQFHNEGSNRRMVKLTEYVIDCFSTKDEERLKSLLCERTLGMSGIDEQIREAFDLMGGGILSYDDPKYPDVREGRRKQNE